MKKNISIGIVLVALLLVVVPSALAGGSSPGNPDVGEINLSATTDLHYYDNATDPEAWAWNHDLWYLNLEEGCQATVEITWFDWYQTQDVYEFRLDGAYITSNIPGGTEEVVIDLTVGGSYEVRLDWIEYKGRDPISGGSYYDITFVVTSYECAPPVVDVDIDIKPGSDPNSINLKSKGKVPVAVLTTDTFDATTVDPVTVVFAGASPVRWAIEDVDGDGDDDLSFKFKTQELLGVLDANSIEATLTGETFDGMPIQGVDGVNIVPKG